MVVAVDCLHMTTTGLVSSWFTVCMMWFAMRLGIMEISSNTRTSK